LDRCRIGAFKNAAGVEADVNRPVHDPGDQNDETVKVTLSRRHVRAALQLLSVIADAWDRNSHPMSDEAIAVSSGRRHLVNQALGILHRRRQRARYFGPMFGEPAWDMLLVLYAHECHDRFKVSRLVEQSGGPATTGLRWLDYLENQQLVRRERDPLDARAMFVDLTDKGRTALDTYLSETVSRAP
jgi:DNA-binding MarR family transcriptional regulator